MIFPVSKDRAFEQYLEVGVYGRLDVFGFNNFIDEKSCEI